MHILITGGAGFVGSNLAIALKKKYPAYTITCLDNLKRRGSEFNLSHLRENDISFIHGDIRNYEDLESIPEFDCMIEASAEPSVLAGITSPIEQVLDNNLIGAMNCLRLAKKFNAFFIFLSSSRVYPIKHLNNIAYSEQPTRFALNEKQDLPGISIQGVSENFPLSGSRSFYGFTKLAAELLIQEYHDLVGLPMVINRCGVIAGPGQMGKVDQGFITLWVARHYWKEQLAYIGFGGMGKQVRDILHIEDLFSLIDYQIHHVDKVNGDTLNIGGGLNTSLSLSEATKLCEEVTGNKIQISTEKETRPADVRIYYTDSSYAKNKINWYPKKLSREIIQDVFEWIHQNESSLKNILRS